MRSFALRPKEARALAVVSVIVILSLFSGPNRTPVAAQKLTANEFSTGSLSNSLLTIPDDIMPPISAAQRDQATISAVTSDYKVIPILFVPNDATPNPFGRQGIDRIMQSVQRWYGEQLRDRSFSLEPARIVVGTHPSLIVYLGDDNYIKLVRVFDGYHKLEFLAEMNGTIVEQTSTPSAGWVPIKVTRIGNEYRGSYSTDSVTWRPLGQPVVAPLVQSKDGLNGLQPDRRSRDCRLLRVFSRSHTLKTEVPLMTHQRVLVGGREDYQRNKRLLVLTRIALVAAFA